MAGKYVTCNLEEIVVGEPLPCNLFIFINFRFITYLLAGDSLSRDAYDRFDFKKVKTLFILAADQARFEAWSAKAKALVKGATGGPPMLPEIAKARDEARRKAMDIFQSGHPDKAIAQTLQVSKNLVDEVMKHPYAVKSLSQLQGFSQGTVDHSVNVSVLSVYLAMQMGYSHAIILQQVGTGGLLHDVGKTQVKILDEDSVSVISEKMKAHPELGVKMLDAQQKVPNEVKLIVGQHHEHHDGTGYPKKLKGAQIYDLAKIVSIANVFDELVTAASGTLVERQRHAIKQLDGPEAHKFDPQKLEKSLKILKLGV
ncbi:MAG: HD domain-containing protein [Oligoflexia bacterium]|nr:HD domain-containing protein [Oligoflexia bacterium]